MVAQGWICSLSHSATARAVPPRALCLRARRDSKSSVFRSALRKVTREGQLSEGGATVSNQVQTPEKDERVTTAVRIPKPLYKRLKHAAIDAEVSVNKLLQQAAERYLADMAETSTH